MSRLLWPRRNRFARQPVGSARPYLPPNDAKIVHEPALAMPDIADPVAEVVAPTPVGSSSLDIGLAMPTQLAPVGQVAASLGTATISIAAPAVVTRTAHGLANGARVYLTTTGALPTGVVASQLYFVVNSAANTFQIANTSGGAAVSTSGTQSGTHTLYVVQ